MQSTDWSQGVKEARVAPRALALLGVLLAVALGLSALVSVAVPAEWNDWLPVPRLGFGFGPGRPPAFTGDVPGTSPSVAPGEFPRTGSDGGRRVIGFWPFGGPRTAATGFVGQVAGMLLLLGGGMLTLYAMPRRMGRIATTLQGGANLVQLALVGLAGYIVLAVLGVLAATSLLGGITAILLILLVYFSALVGLVALGLRLGRWLNMRFGIADQPPLFNLMAGLLLLFIIGLVPFAGAVALALLVIAGFGAIVLTRAGSERGWDFDLRELRY